MKNKMYFRLGILVTAALLMLVGMLFFLGMAKQFAPRIKMVTTFQESVQGLTAGAAVKLQGVPVGSVDALHILVDKRLIEVEMSINPDVFIQPDLPLHSGEHLDAVRKILVTTVANGLQCRLEMAGVTGMRYVEMSYLPPEKRRKEPLPAIDVPKDAIYVASAPGTISNMIDSVGEALTKIAQVDFPGISKSLDENLDELNAILSNPAINSSLERIDHIAANLETTSRNLSENVTGENIQKLFDNANRTMDELNRLNLQLQKKIEPIDTGRISAETADTLKSIQSMSGELAKVRSSIERTMQQLNSFLAGTSELVDLLKRDPNALLRGKSTPEVKP